MAQPGATQQPTGGMKIHTVTGGGGLRLQAREWGNADGPPILFIHGLSQNHLCWHRQYESALVGEFRLAAYDLRGHGMSDAPLEAEHYIDGKLWADDLAAVIDQLRLDRPVLVGWSYGSLIACDYVRAHGQDQIAAIDVVGGAFSLGPSAFGTLIGSGFLDHFADLTADDLPTNIRAVRGLVKAFAAKPLPAEDVETLLCSSMAVPARIRANLDPEIDCDDVLRALEVPLLITHGRADTVVLPAIAEQPSYCTTASRPGTKAWPTRFLEQPERFNRELAEFTRRARSRSSAQMPGRPEPPRRGSLARRLADRSRRRDRSEDCGCISR